MTVVDNEKKALKHIAKPSFDNLNKITDNFMIIRKLKNEVKLDKPFYVGVAVLDYSKFKCITITMESLKIFTEKK